MGWDPKHGWGKANRLGPRAGTEGEGQRARTPSRDRREGWGAGTPGRDRGKAIGLQSRPHLSAGTLLHDFVCEGGTGRLQLGRRM